MDIQELLKNPNLTEAQRETLLKLAKMDTAEINKFLYNGISGQPHKPAVENPEPQISRTANDLEITDAEWSEITPK